MGQELISQLQSDLAIKESKLAMQDIIIAEYKNTIHDIIHKYERTISELNLRVEDLELQLELQKIRQFSKKSEKIYPEPVDEHCEAEQDDATDLPESSEPKKKTGRAKLSKLLARQTIIHDIPESEKTCKCGNKLMGIKGDSSEQLGFIPCKLYVTEHKLKKYVCKNCEDVVKQAKLPPQPIPKSIASPGLLAHIMVSKYRYHLPLYRQEEMLRSSGAEISRATLSSWMIKGAELLRPLYELLRKEIVSYDVAYADETRVQVLKEEDRKAESQSFMWVFGGGSPEKYSQVYHYSSSRSHEIALEFLEGFAGYLHCDGYGAYNTLGNKSDITQVGCWYHCRRKFVDAAKVSKKHGLSWHAIQEIRKLSKIEESIKNCDPSEIHMRRLKESKPIMDKFFEWITEHIDTVPKESLIGKAMHYANNQKDKLSQYLQDGRLEISNNRTERAIKPFALGRKNWLFSNSPSGAEASSIIYSFIQTCIYHGIEPFDWLKYVFEKIPSCKRASDEELAQLLPYNVDRNTLKQINDIVLQQT